MKVFITGATGYIGFSVAQNFSRHGHTVFGLTRSDIGAKKLKKAEVIPVYGDITNPKTYQEIATNAEVLIHCAFDYTSKEGVSHDLDMIHRLVKIGSAAALPKHFIYTSGVWVIGNTNECKIDESTSPNPLNFVKWRMKHEHAVLSAVTSSFKTTVIRPGCVYGGSGGLTASFFTSAKKGSVEVLGDGENSWAMIHKDDLAESYRLVAEKEQSGLFNIVDHSHLKINDIAKAIAIECGIANSITHISKEDAVKRLGPYAEGLLANQYVSNERAKRLLNWHPSHGSFLDRTKSYLEAWEHAS